MVISRSPEISDRKSSQEGNDHFLAIYSDFPPFRAVIHILPILLSFFVYLFDPVHPAEGIVSPRRTKGVFIRKTDVRAQEITFSMAGKGEFAKKETMLIRKGEGGLKISTDHATDGHACIQRLDELMK
ncbi:hypothetical protein CEXT_634801 [Caerostris extrusa]|uniref:Uncharacterized protein n=1 Tax=Caerostris extrusa TaxID=172846 RepID=A0AAV4R9R5_CAEEX|nr:hypothetical protein CEXT_634801 [Caerostris extrusa]